LHNNCTNTLSPLQRLVQNTLINATKVIVHTKCMQLHWPSFPWHTHTYTHPLEPGIKLNLEKRWWTY
jgi:hypothetical protein